MAFVSIQYLPIASPPNCPNHLTSKTLYLSQMTTFTPTQVPEVLLIQPHVHMDKRGLFLETYNRRDFVAAGISDHFVQDNQSGSHQGTLRGLHYQIRQAQGKLVQVLVGEIFDVAVDLRKVSPTFRQWVGIYLSGENRHQVWVPTGFAHGFYVISDWAQVLYKVTDYYAPEWERTLLWNDPAIGINWPIPPGQSPILSSKDAIGKPLAEAELFDS